MDSRKFSSFLTICQYGGTIIANPLNIFLIYLILTKSSKKMGNYKYLMIYVSINEIFFSFVAYATEPLLHSFSTRVIVIMKYRDTIFSKEFAFFMDCMMCAVYGSSMTVFSIHFLYRYASLYTKAKQYFDGWKILIWISIPQVCGAIWLAIYYFVFPQTVEFTEFIRKHLLENLDINVDDIVYVGPYYYPEDLNGVHELDWVAFWSMAVVWLMMGSSALTVVIGGIGCYKKISKGLAMSSNSAHTKSIQKELFNALVMQSAIPFLLMYIPSSIVLFCTLIRIDIGSASCFISYSVAIYPAIDPLPSMLIVKNYRNAIRDMLTCAFAKNPTQSSSMQLRSARIQRNQRI